MPAVIFAIGLLLRVLMLTGPKSFWGDEWFSLGLAQRSFAEVFWASIHDVHPPFYFLLLRAAVCCFGQGEWAFRLVSFVAGLGTLAAVYRLSRLIFQNQTARWAIFLTAISPYWLQSSNEVRSYSLLGFLASLTAVFFAEALCHPEKKFWKWAYAMSAIFLVYTEHYGWFLVAAAIAAQGYLWTRKKLPLGLGRAQRVMLIFAVPSLCLIGYQAVFGEHMFDLSRVREYFAWPLIFKKIVGIFWHFSSGYRF
ncbi:MAG: glycosyltransferase family 39 protein [Candidatus Omnitrophica bacterium]|nr:glycosyltransferase family 39 protein [Candidatus Omnitrophota bacterium]